jgi:hypothetical protein
MYWRRNLSTAQAQVPCAEPRREHRYYSGHVDVLAFSIQTQIPSTDTDTDNCTHEFMGVSRRSILTSRTLYSIYVRLRWCCFCFCFCALG